MDNFTTLFTQYSAVEVIYMLILIGLSFKLVSELVDWFKNKGRVYFKKETQQENLVDKLDIISEKLDSLSDQISSLEQRVDSTETAIHSLKDKVKGLTDAAASLEEQSQKTDESLNLVQDRLQNQARDRLIELHHKYVYEYKMIDDIGLQSMERTYFYYKAAGGNTFIDTLMDEVRELPRPALENRAILEAIQ